jgi:2-polyprenyl-3-methyl-5-hydroxy-6-metoxy-1,4-benzoquinol methylase
MNQYWWKKVFKSAYRDIFAPLYDEERTKKEVDFVLKVAKPSKSVSILDLACGQGRHSLELGRRGYRITGVDYSQELLGVARENAVRDGVLLTYHKQDIRELNIKNKFDLVFMFGNSFGYFSDADNIAVLKKVRAHLKPHGKFILDLPNTAGMLRNPMGSRNDKTEFGEVITENTSFDPVTNRMSVSWKFSNSKIKESHRGEFRLYTHTEIKMIIESIGFKYLKTYGSFTAEKLTIDSPRMIIVLEK